WKCRLLSLFYVLMLLLEGTIGNFNQVGAEVKKKARDPYHIAVVYDNSGSMYIKKDQTIDAWCRTKYAMGIFASMLDYPNGDVMQVFPMHKVKIGSREMDNFSITSYKEISYIDQFKTPQAGNTPYETVEKAIDSLRRSNSINKWLIILTDGAFDGATPEKITTELEGLQSQGINVQYLAIKNESGEKVDEIQGENFFSRTAKTGEDLNNALIDMCNQIFKRNELKDALDSRKQIKLDVSMSKVFVFVQGNNARIGKLRQIDGNRKEAAVVKGSNQTIKTSKVAADYRKIIKNNGTLKLEKIENPKIANGLQGQIITFEKCPKGIYQLEYEGEKIQIFYEPDVEVYVKILDADETHEFTKEELKKGIEPGKYKIKYGIRDKNNKNKDITNNKLLGKVELSGKIVQEGNIQKNIKNGGTFDLKENMNADIEVLGTYLEDYTISSKDSENFNLSNIKVWPKTDKYKVRIQGMDKPYVLTNQKNWKPIIVKVTRKGKKVKKEEFEKLKPEFTFSNNESFYYETDSENSQYKVYLGKSKGGKNKSIKPNDGTFRVRVSGTDEHGRPMSGTSKKDYQINRLETWVVWLLWILIILLITTLVLFILTRMILPNKMTDVISERIVTVDGMPDENAFLQVLISNKEGLPFKNKCTIRIMADDIYDGYGNSIDYYADINIEAIDRFLFTMFKSKERKFKINSINGNVDVVEISGIEIEKDENERLVIPGETLKRVGNCNIELSSKYQVPGRSIVRTVSVGCKIIRK
ncbi:MAG: hypothetical protein K6G85_05220, partial [Eubacterium sp.]|nr:hypothetical protein [Eubacterium sp.]